MILDTLGKPVICTQYTVAAGNNIPGYFTSTLQANNSPVRYKPWTSVAMDLTPLIGQNVKLRFTTYDCSLGGHFGYAYVDGLCTSFQTAVKDTTCNGTPKQMCAPVGFATYSWTGPGITNNPNICISPVLPGTYTCQTILVPGCPGPAFVHTLTALPTPSISFTGTNASNCDLTYSFTSVATISAGTIASRLWFFGDNTTSTLTNPVKTYAAAGTYTVKLRVTAATGCRDSATQVITIHPFPNLSFSPPSNCVNTVVQFTNTSTITSGSIVSYVWNLGNSVTSTLSQPATTYSANGTYSVTLVAISNMGCIASRTNSLGIFPPPIISFSAAPLCDVNGTTFSPSTSTAIASGSLVGFAWNFGDGGTSTLQTPVHIYATPGSYTVTFTGTSNHACIRTVTNTFNISPSPDVAFSTTSVNACTSTFSFNNTSTISAGSVSYTWNLGGSTTTVTSPSYTFPSIGTYTVLLTGISDLGCVDIAQQVITIHPYPVINFNVPSPCENAIFTVSTSAVSGSVTSYKWDFGDPGSGTSNTSTAQNPTHVYNSVGTYTVSLDLLSNLNCPSSSVAVVFVHPNPTALMITQAPLPCETTFSFANTSTVTSVNSTSIAGQIWNFGSGTLTGAPSQTNSFPGPGSYTVSMIAVTNRNCMDTAYQVVTIHPRPVISFTAVPPTCVGSTVVFNSTASISPVPSTGASVPTHTWSYGDNTFSNFAAAPPHVYTGPGTYTITYSATSNQGCISTVQQTLQIHPNPTVAIAVNNLCRGDITAFTSTTGVIGGIITGDNWDFGNGGSANTNTISYTYPLAGTYTVSYTATSNNSCNATQTMVVTVSPLPTVSIANASICADSPLTFTNNSTIPAPFSITSYTWNLGDGSALQNTIAPVYSYSTAGTYTTTLAVTSNSGCPGSDTALITIYPRPTTSFAATSACMNSPVTFSNSTFIQGASPITYTWNFGDGITSNQVQPVHTYSTFSSYIPTLTALSNQGCVRDFTINLLIHPQALLPDFSFTNTCHGDNTGFTNLTPTLVPPTSTVTGFAWNFGDGFSASGSNTTHIYQTIGSYNVTFSASTDHNCVSTISKTVVILPLPVVSFTALNVCLNVATNFTNNSTISPNPPNQLSVYNWQTGDGTAYNGGPLHAQHTYTNAGTFTPTLTVISNMGCSKSGVSTVVVHPRPVVNFSPPSACANTTLQIANSSSIALPGSIVSYTWDYGNGATSNVTSPVYSYSVANSYTMSLTAMSNNGCDAAVTRTLAIYPNPEVTVTPVQNGCMNDAVTFDSNISIPSTGITSYTWNFGDSTPLTTIQSSTISKLTPHTYTAYNTYTINLSAKSTQNCITSTYTTITIYPKPLLSFTASYFCQNDITNFVNTSFVPSNGSITSTFWNFNDGAATSNSFHTQHVFTKDSTYNVVMTATSNPEAGISCISSISKSVVINPLPLVSFAASTACIGKPTQFTNTSPTLNVAGWGWDFDADGLSNSSFESPTFIYPSAGTYTTILKVKNSFNCVKSYSAEVTVLASPVVTLAGSQTCLGEPTFFTLATPVTNKSYTWNFGGGIKFDNTAPNYTFATAGTHTVSLVLKDLNTTCESTNMLAVHIDDVPVLNFTANPVCLENTTQFLNYSSIPNGTIVIYKWDYDNNGWDDSSSTGSILPYKYATSGIHNFKLYGRSNNGCKAEKSGPVRIYDKPHADFFVQKICAGDKITFTNLSNATDGEIKSYFWDYNNDNVNDGDGIAASHTYSVFGEYNAKLSVISEYGCAASVIHSVEVHPKPVAVYSADKTSGCPPVCVNFENMSYIPRGTFTSNWNFGDLSPVEIVKDPSHCFSSGSYNLSLKLVSDQNCVTELKHPGYVNVYSLPVAGFAVEPPEVDEDEPFVTVKNEAADVISTRYFINDGINYGSPDFTHTFRNLDKKIKPMIVQIVTNEYGCMDTTFKVLEIKPAFTIYVPNVFTPNSDGLNDGFGAKGVGIIKFSMQIFDRWGHMVFSSGDIHDTWDGTAKGSSEVIKQDEYTWKIQVTDIFGKNHNLIGGVTVLR